jgi:chloramphenicol-sensitive protein RarD
MAVSATTRGTLAAGLGFVMWGLFPLYFRLVEMNPALEVLANRIVWALALLLVLMTLRGGWGWLREVLHAPRVLAAFGASALLLSVNWLTYLWAVDNGHVIDASLGYFITPLVSVALGYTVLHERPRRTQWAALALAAAGVVWLTVIGGKLPWIGLVLAGSFGAYGLLRKVAVLGALEGLTLETIVLAPLAFAVMAFWWNRTPGSFPADDLAHNAWLLGLGPITAVPLLLFAYGARRIPLTGLGVLQYLAPTLQFIVGLSVFHEPFAPARFAGFALIWLALGVYTADAIRSAQGQTPDPA